MNFLREKGMTKSSEDLKNGCIQMDYGMWVSDVLKDSDRDKRRRQIQMICRDSFVIMCIRRMLDRRQCCQRCTHPVRRVVH